MSDSAPRRVLVLVPTYNELESLPTILARLREAVPDADILILDDASPDGTGELADELAAHDSHVQVMHRVAKEGLGAAYLAGFAWGLERGYDALVEIDADGSHPPSVLPKMLQAAARADVVIGSRWVPGGSVRNWPRQREALSRGANLYTRLLLGMQVRDATAGYRVYRADALRRLRLEDVASAGYCFQIDLTWRAAQAGMRIVEIPITFVEREVGVSKMSSDIMRESLVNITSWGLHYRAGQLARLLPGRSR
ncbi:polyprenol monophosphomannose synthase [Allobranchiibius huperziae]|uniref:Dolichol-phosphate mannosyltransferase n=1 Tax=Allobranchiibius huperziae TaxID=1874116 RepID=A0A853DCN1_9MICO|nr:polyprenol monophosphomannose synthase [Allobranchiibius huperziae]NYJ74658.1 dolichol-phosphate mannosyltransferase [Allobranchiibius huperziae]